MSTNVLPPPPLLLLTTTTTIAIALIYNFLFKAQNNHLISSETIILERQLISALFTCKDHSDKDTKGICSVYRCVLSLWWGKNYLTL